MRFRTKGQRAGRICAGSMVALGLVAMTTLTASPTPAAARIDNPIAVFAALDKVTARISKLEVPLNETVEFGTLRITPRVCYSREPTEPPKTSTFVEVRDVTLNEGEKKIFSGWMFAESPGLHAVEHPVFDVWLTGCKGGAQPQARQNVESDNGEARRPVQRRRRRVRR
jgi:hypothetical protein